MDSFWAVIRVLKPSEVKAATGRVLDKAIKSPQFVERNAILLVIMQADLVPAGRDELLDKPRRNRVLLSLDDSEGW
jgi:hypothetical protein